MLLLDVFYTLSRQIKGRRKTGHSGVRLLKPTTQADCWWVRGRRNRVTGESVCLNLRPKLTAGRAQGYRVVFPGRDASACNPSSSIGLIHAITQLIYLDTVDSNSNLLFNCRGNRAHFQSPEIFILEGIIHCKWGSVWVIRAHVGRGYLLWPLVHMPGYVMLTHCSTRTIAPS